LELDCEGAEKEILSEMKIRPDVIIVETHPNFNSGPKIIQEILAQKGYRIVNQLDRGNVPVLTAVRHGSEGEH
jgi:hypothetical protein